MLWLYHAGPGDRPLMAILWFLTCRSVCIVQDMSNEGGQKGGRRMEVSLASRLLRTAGLGQRAQTAGEMGGEREAYL